MVTYPGSAGESAEEHQNAGDEKYPVALDFEALRQFIPNCSDSRFNHDKLGPQWIGPTQHGLKHERTKFCPLTMKETVRLPESHGLLEWAFRGRALTRTEPTTLSSPTIKTMKKKTADQNCDRGNLVITSGYMMKARPGPKRAHPESFQWKWTYGNGRILAASGLDVRFVSFRTFLDDLADRPANDGGHEADGGEDDEAGVERSQSHQDRHDQRVPEKSADQSALPDDACTYSSRCGIYYSCPL